VVDSSNGAEDRHQAARLGEVIETSTVRIWTECDELNALPRLGSVVEVATAEGDSILAVVSYCETAGIDSTRRAVRRGSNDIRDADVYSRHPELARVLRSTFEAVPVAFLQGATLRCIVPPVPPPLHYSVGAASGHVLRDLTDRLEYLTLIARYSGEVAAEQVLVAHIREAYGERGNDDLWLEHVAAEIGRIYARDYDLLLPILRAIDPGVQSIPIM
jgi:hypothetical protein